MVNVGANDNQVPPKDSQVPLLEEFAMGDQVSVAPPPMTDGDIRKNFPTLTKDMTSQYNAITSQVQVMMTQINRGVGP